MHGGQVTHVRVCLKKFLGIGEDRDTDSVSVVDVKVAGVGRTRVGAVFTSTAVGISMILPG